MNQIFKPWHYYINEKQLYVINEIRYYFNKLNYGMRNILISNAHAIPDLNFLKGELSLYINNFNKFLLTFYNSNTINNLNTLQNIFLNSYIDSINNFKDNTKTNDTNFDALENAGNELYQFLIRLNPYLKNTRLNINYDKYLANLEEEISNRFKGNYSLDIANFNNLNSISNNMADNISYALIKQFNNLFI